MSQEGSVAPKERVNIRYKTDLNGQTEQKELPNRLLMIGDYTQRPDKTPVAERKPISINKNNFNAVLASHELNISMSVPDRLSEEEGGQLGVSLSFSSIKDFEPEQVAKQVPELNKLVEIREALTALKGQLGSVPEFRRKLQKIIQDPDGRKQLLEELGLEENSSS